MKSKFDKPRLCPHCKQPISPLSPQEAKIFDMVEAAGKHGLLKTSIYERLYADADGGPESDVVAVAINRINKKIRPTLGKEMVPIRGRGTHTEYVVRSIW